MIEWIVSSCVLIVLILVIRKLFRRKLQMRTLYALWLLVAVRLLIPFSFAESTISVQNLVRAVGEAVATDVPQLQESGMPENSMQGSLPESGNLTNQGTLSEGENWTDGEPAYGSLAEGNASFDDLAGVNSNHDNLWDVNVNRGNFVEGNADGKNLAVENVSGEAPEDLFHVNMAASMGKIFTYIWLVGATVSLIVLAGANALYRRGVYLSRERKDRADSRLPVYFSNKVNTPCMFGVFRPAIYLTEQACADEKALKYILCHENTHYRHRDNWWAVVRALCVCLHWYNPLVWLAAYVSKQDCELACDEETIKQLDAAEKIDYGRVLLDFSITGGTLYGKLQLATTMSGGKKQLKERLQMIVREPKRYVSALIIVALLLVLVTGVTFTGRAEESGGMQSVPGTETDMDSEQKGSEDSEEQNAQGAQGDSEEQNVQGEPEGSENQNVQAEAESSNTQNGADEQSNQNSGGIFAYQKYTGYMDECPGWEEGFGEQDYDEDGLFDRVYRESIEDRSLCSYHIEFGSGEVLKVEKIGSGMPAVSAGDLDGDGVNEILFRLAYGYSTDPTGFGEWAVYQKGENGYEMLRLPGEIADYEGAGNGGSLPAYQPEQSFEVEVTGDFQVRICSVGVANSEKSGEGSGGETELDVTVSIDEEDWEAIDFYYLANMPDEYAESVYTAEIVEGTQPCIKMYASMFGKWCLDEVETTLVLVDGSLQVQSMQYIQHYSLDKTVDLNDGNEYYLSVLGERQLNSNVHRIYKVHLYRVGEKADDLIDTLDLEAVTTREWGSAQDVSAYAADGNMILEDLNFDGYNDLAIQGWMAIRNIPYYCWLWNPMTRQYEYSGTIANIELDKENQLIISATGNGGGEYSVAYYRYDEQNALHMVRYTEENLSPEALFEKLDLTYYMLDYSLPAVDEYDADNYGGTLNSKIIYYAKQALTELYQLTGYKVEQAYFTVTETGDIYFAQTEDDMNRGRMYYNRSYKELDGDFDIIPSMNVITERSVWYSPVIWWNVPDNQDSMTDEELVQWYFERSAFAAEEKVVGMTETFEDNYVIMAMSGNFYEVSFDGDKRLLYSIYGPYPEFPTH